MLAAASLATAAIAAPAPLDPGVYAPRTDAPVLTRARVVTGDWACTAHDRDRTASGYAHGRTKSLASLAAISQCQHHSRHPATCKVVCTHP
jgi:hypothetical protein